MKGWPKLDADIILYFEVVLMGLFLLMNGTDLAIQTNFPSAVHYAQAGSFPVSQYLLPLFEDTNLDKLCLLYTSDAADDSLRVDLGGRRIIKKTRYGLCCPL